MRLSDVKGDRTFDVVADIIVPISNIAEDPDSAALFRREKLPAGADAKRFLMERVKEHIPKLLRAHKRDLICIFATIEGIGEEEYAKSLTLAKLARDSAELLTDEAFISFFTQTGTPYGDASESTEAQAE